MPYEKKPGEFTLAKMNARLIPSTPITPAKARRQMVRPSGLMRGFANPKMGGHSCRHA